MQDTCKMLPDGGPLGMTKPLRIVRVQPSSVATAVSALKRLRPTDLKVGGFAQLRADDPEPIVEQMTQMANASGRKQLIEAVAAAKEGI